MHFHIPPRRPGAYADIIAVDGDPSRSIKAVENMQLVMKEGELCKSQIKELANGARSERRFLVPAQRWDFSYNLCLTSAAPWA
jgi:hypothetical protein